MERVSHVSRTARLVEQPGKMINFIYKKSSDHMEPSQTAFAMTGQPSKLASPLPHNCSPGGPAH